MPTPAGSALLEGDGYAPGVVITSTGVDRRRTLSRLAFAIAVLDLLAVAYLIIFYAAGGPFGTANDVANGLVGLLSMALAWLWISPRTTLWSRVGIAAATVGGIVMMIAHGFISTSAT